MSSPILVTKLYIPPPPPKVVRRPRLIQRLDEGLSEGSKLSLIAAPAGFGKTTLVSEWVDNLRHVHLAHTAPVGWHRGMQVFTNDDLPVNVSKEDHRANRKSEIVNRVAWLSLDEGDSEPVRFLTYLITALRTIAPNLAEGVLGVLQSPQPPIESLLTALVNEISAVPGKFIFVLDDYHMIDNREVDNVLTFLLEHLPPQLHIVITTREDPALPLPRLRARGHLTELRAADLRFTPAEAAEFLNQVMELNLSAEDISALETRTEGWIAGLQLAALSMKGKQDVTGFIQAFAGDHRYIVDYLVEEVLQRQPEDIRIFLLQTSILDRLNGSLCDAVIGIHPEGGVQPGSSERLENLQRSNLFLIPLDDKRHWYRYHHLFADVLHMHLMAEQPGQVPLLHHRASEWYEQNDLTAEAIRHALAAQNFERAADLIERALPVMRRSRQESTLLGWLKALPDEVLQYRPVLSVHYAGTLLQTGHLDGVEERLRDAERWLNMPADGSERPIFVDEEEFQRLPGSVAMYHAAIALARGDVADTMKYARQVLELTREDDYFMRGAASSLLGLASWTAGDLETAYRLYSDGMAYLQKIGYISDVIGGSVTLAEIRITQGRLREAMSIYERGLHLATTEGDQILRGAADMHVGMSELYRERNQLETAMQHLLKSKEPGDLNGLPKNPYRWRVAMARMREIQGDPNAALNLLDEAERLYQGDFSPNVRPVSALKARIWIAQGRLPEALAWARQQGLSAQDEPGYLREFEHITLARLLLATSKRDPEDRFILDALGLLERLRKAAEEGGRIGNLIEILVVQALANQMRGDIPSALTSLEKALRLAEPEDYVRVFVDEGESVRLLIEDLRLKIERQSRQHDGLIPYIDKLQDAFADSSAAPESSIPPSEHQESKLENLVEPLSQRELEILRLFKTELSGPEIARQLVIGLSTVRTHTKSIYSKLNVNSRRAAVKRAVELGLI